MDQGQKCKECGAWVPADEDGDQSDLCEECSTFVIYVTIYNTKGGKDEQ